MMARIYLPNSATLMFLIGAVIPDSATRERTPLLSSSLTPVRSFLTILTFATCWGSAPSLSLHGASKPGGSGGGGGIFPSVVVVDVVVTSIGQS